MLARFKSRQTEQTYRIYVTDSIRLRAEGKYISKRWWALVSPEPEVDAEKIISDIVKRAGLEVLSDDPT